MAIAKVAFSRIDGSISARFADRVARDDEEHELERDGHADEPVVVLRVRDRRGIVRACLRFEEVLRRDAEKPVDAGPAEHLFREVHGRPPIPEERTFTAEIPGATGGPA
jgi:hypothetical protein